MHGKMRMEKRVRVKEERKGRRGEAESLIKVRQPNFTYFIYI